MDKPHYHKKTYCCKTGCPNCPFNFTKTDPNVPEELLEKKKIDKLEEYLKEHGFTQEQASEN